MIGYNSPRGFALLIAIVLSGVAAAVTFALTSIAYKSLILSSASRESQFAFYAADSALECALFADNGANNKFAYSVILNPTTISCGGSPVTLTATRYSGTTEKYQSPWFTVNTDATTNPATTRCAQIIVYKSNVANSSATKIFTNGTNVSCADSADPRAIERGLKIFY